MFDNIKYFICPMTKNVVDCVLEMKSSTFGILPTLRQVNFNGGYVNKWKTENFFDYVKSINKDIVVERDHFGLNQGSANINNDLNTDIKYFNIIHIDPFKQNFNYFKDYVDETIFMIKHIYSQNKNVKFEIGTEEKIYTYSEKDLFYFLQMLKNQLSPDEYENVLYVCIQSGVEIDLINRLNIGKFNQKKLNIMTDLTTIFNKKAKEHNGDYLSATECEIRFKNGVSAINIGPEFAQIETQVYLDNLSINELNDFYIHCLESKKWERWVNNDFNINDKYNLCMICGHYNYEYLPQHILSEPVLIEKIKHSIKIRLCELESAVPKH